MVIRYTLRKIANKRPLLFWLDDLHNAGPATIDGLLRSAMPVSSSRSIRTRLLNSPLAIFAMSLDLLQGVTGLVLAYHLDLPPGPAIAVTGGAGFALAALASVIRGTR